MKLLFSLLFVLFLVHAFEELDYEDEVMDLKKKAPKKCQADADCESTHYCKTIKLPGGKKAGVCLKKCPPAGATRTKCTRRCPCGQGEGPCKRRKHCKKGLRCKDKKCVPKPVGSKSTIAPAAPVATTPAPEFIADTDFEVIGEDNGDEANPYDLVAQCKTSADCTPPLVCRRVRLHKLKKEVRICAPKLPGMLDDESLAWDFFAEDAADETAQDLKKGNKPKPKKCTSDADCTSPKTCYKKKGKTEGKCKPPCPSTTGARTKRCSKRCKCGAGQGPCRRHSVCIAGHECDASKKCVKKAVPATTAAAAPPQTTMAPFDDFESEDDVEDDDEFMDDAIPDEDVVV